MAVCEESVIVCQEKVAVLLATYNGEKYLHEQLDSLLAQSCQDFCCYIHDDGSSDHTMDIVRKYCRQYPEKFFCIEAPPAGGAKKNFMYLLHRIEAAYLMFCDQDDVWFPHKIETSLNKMKEAEAVYGGSILFHSDLKFVDSNQETIAESYYQYTGKDKNRNSLKQLLVKNIVVGCTVMINRQLRREALEYKDLDNIYMHDWWIALLAAMNGHIEFEDKPLLLYRQHEGNVTGMKFKQTVFQKIKKYLPLGTAAKSKKEYLYRKVLLAKELISHVQDSDETEVFLSQLSELSNKDKYQRIRLYINNELFEKNKNILWQMLWV